MADLRTKQKGELSSYSSEYMRDAKRKQRAKYAQANGAALVVVPRAARWPADALPDMTDHLKPVNKKAALLFAGYVSSPMLNAASEAELDSRLFEIATMCNVFANPDTSVNEKRGARADLRKIAPTEADIELMSGYKFLDQLEPDGDKGEAEAAAVAAAANVADIRSRVTS